MNLAAPEGTSGDWHDVFHWQDGTEQPRQVTLAGMGDIDTSPIYGDLGIYEGRDRLVAQGLDIPIGMQQVYIANHSRAIEQLLEQATMLEPAFHPAAQDKLRRWIADEARTLRAVRR